eukprot:3413665-Pyramimonas_sp.AAC.1
MPLVCACLAARPRRLTASLMSIVITMPKRKRDSGQPWLMPARCCRGHDSTPSSTTANRRSL